MTVTKTRKTAAQKRAEAEALRIENQRYAEDRFLGEYQSRLLKLIHAYISELPHSIESAGEDEYLAFEFKTSRYNNVRLPLDTSSDLRSIAHIQEDMEDAEQFLETNREEQRLERERAAKKSAALAKLSKEERELLGV